MISDFLVRKFVKNSEDVENENVMLAENQLKYQGLLTSINQEFTNLQTVIK